MKKILSVIILFLFTSSVSANDRDIELDKLFLELKKNIPSLSSRIAQQIWTLWSTHPSDQKLTSLLDEGSRLVQDRQLKRAINVFSEAIELDPSWAEASAQEGSNSIASLNTLIALFNCRSCTNLDPSSKSDVSF